MATLLDLNDPVIFKELLIANFMQVDALAELMIRKGFITKEEFLDMWKQVQFTYQRKATMHLMIDFFNQ